MRGWCKGKILNFTKQEIKRRREIETKSCSGTDLGVIGDILPEFKFLLLTGKGRRGCSQTAIKVRGEGPRQASVTKVSSQVG